MILEGFEIANWSCIKHVAVDALPATGVTVLHGPNGTGKSSIIEALRACLMDNKSTSKALGRGLPKNTSEKPRVSVTFRAAGTSWRITKQFNSRECKLERRTPAGEWKMETADGSEAHDRTRQLTGANNSSLGLYQLLWLTQAEIRLPDAKSFDCDVQSRLRGVLGVLQTPLDDRFRARVTEGWARWFGGHSTPGEKPKLKKGCPLEKALALLEQHRAELDEVERQFRTYENFVERSTSLEVLSRKLRGQLEHSTRVHDDLQKEYERSLTHLHAHQLASVRVTSAEESLKNARGLRQRRADAEQNAIDAERSAADARRRMDEEECELQGADTQLRKLRRSLEDLGIEERELRTQQNGLGERRKSLLLRAQLNAARDKLRQAEEISAELEELREHARTHPAPDPNTLASLEENRRGAAKARADLEAAALRVILLPDAQAATPRLAIDGAPAKDAKPPANGAPFEYFVRRRAEMAFPGWGRAEVTRGSDSRTLDQVETALQELDRLFGDGVAPFGIAATEPTALDQLRALAAEKKVRDPKVTRRKNELDGLVPAGIDVMRQEVCRLEKLYQAASSEVVSQWGLPDLTNDVGELDRIADALAGKIAENAGRAAAVRGEIVTLEQKIDPNMEVELPQGKGQIRARAPRSVALGLRQQADRAQTQYVELNAKANLLREEVNRLPTAEEIEAPIRNAEDALTRARIGLDEAKLSDSEETIGERLTASKDGIRAMQSCLDETQKELNQIEGALRQAEGLHQKRAAVATRVEELTRQTEREKLESEAYDRLYALFEECRDKQLGTVMGPIHDRVLRWMRLLQIGGYQEIRFNDQFLPDKLRTRDGAIELILDEESIGTLEQIGLMVRLALGATLSTPEEPVAAVLDDPLTHSDVVRLDRMRAVLRSASAGDPSGTPPAGPLQILVFTCHPEWFAIDGARVVDLMQPDVLTRSW
jgi:hypothetical protein